jgi:hypothetical protein
MFFTETVTLANIAAIVGTISPSTISFLAPEVVAMSGKMSWRPA